MGNKHLLISQADYLGPFTGSININNLLITEMQYHIYGRQTLLSLSNTKNY